MLNPLNFGHDGGRPDNSENTPKLGKLPRP